MLDDRRAKIDYGTDAPGIVRGLLAAGLGGVGLAVLLVAFGRGWIAVVPALVGAPPLAFGLSMAAYARRGKFRVRDRMLDLVAWRGDERVLDVGTGRAFLAIGAARRAPQGHVVGIDVWRSEDLTGNTAEAARANARAEGVGERVEILDLDASALGFEDGAFDVVLSLLCLHNIEPATAREAACREIARVLRPGGEAVVADYIKTDECAALFRGAGLDVEGPISWRRTALGLMAVVRARRPWRRGERRARLRERLRPGSRKGARTERGSVETIDEHGEADRQDEERRGFPRRVRLVEVRPMADRRGRVVLAVDQGQRVGSDRRVPSGDLGHGRQGSNFPSLRASVPARCRL